MNVEETEDMLGSYWILKRTGGHRHHVEMTWNGDDNRRLDYGPQFGSRLLKGPPQKFQADPKSLRLLGEGD